MELIPKYFPDLSEQQLELYDRLHDLTSDWNQKINVISRKDMDHLEERHILHSLGIAKVTKFIDGSRILDVGTGGGYPGLPLAIMYPQCEFLLVDSIGKKIKVVQDIASQLKLNNVTARHVRAEEIKGEFDFVVSRAVTRLVRFHPWVAKKISKKNRNPIPNGILGLKGGDLYEEIEEFEKAYPDWGVLTFDLSRYFKEEFFDTKKVIHVFRG